MDHLVKKDLEKQGYRFAGEHSAIKVCGWTKKSLKDEGVCYKQKFYGLNCHRCMQTSVSVINCQHNCTFCWRSLEHTKPHKVMNPDNPEEVLDKLLEQHKGFLIGLRGNKKVDREMFDEALDVKHVALSLSGDATLYPYLPELIGLIKSKGMTAFLVTNGQQPDMLAKCDATQTYVTLPAPNEEVYVKTCKPYLKDGWERLMKSLDVLSTKDRSTVRLSLVKGLNDCNVSEYAKLIKRCNPKFVEVKAVMAVGYARYRMDYSDMLLHSEIKEFALKLAKELNWKLIDEHERSRVCLLMKEDTFRSISNASN
jgi:tRNA wybutosine-synthesizing protein 1